MPSPIQFLERVITLLKPNGWLLIEDTCIMDSPRAYGPMQRRRTDIMIAYMTSKDQDPRIGATAAEFVSTNLAFDEVCIRRQLLSYLPLPDDPLVRPLAETMRNSIIRTTTHALSSELIAAGMTPELQKAWKAEMDDTQYDPTSRVYFIWARKRA
ncbi:hypothetical protein EIP86_001388 [Pleurotus ostreatoroseus]|nr:hypothetical protein EIP86_001388 [Pleurotus ostreatoroseus]